MEINEMIDYASTGATWLAIGGAGYLGAVASLVTMDGLLDGFSKKIISQEELEKVVLEESKKLGIKRFIKTKYCSENVAESQISGAGRYTLVLGGNLANRISVRHELYHVYKGHLKEIFDNVVFDELNYWLRQEPQAILYSFSKLKF